MLAYEPGVPVAYDPVLTVVSLLIAISMTGSGFFVNGRADELWRPLAGGVLIGLGIASMHYTGMRALVVPGVVEWDRDLVTVSVVFGVVLASAALVAFAKLRRPWSIWGAAGLLTAAICLLHFTAIGAALVVPDPTAEIVPSFVSNHMMAMAVVAVTLLVILAGLSAALIESQGNRDSVNRVMELADAATEGIVVARDGIILNVNRRVSEICGVSAEMLFGRRVFGDLICEGVDTASRGGGSFEASLNGADGTPVPVEVVRRPFTTGLRANEVYALRDLRERRLAEHRIHYLAHHDPLTGLPNRIALNAKLEAVLRRAKEEHFSFAVLSVDLDRFKDINDIHGHASGDSVLHDAAERLKGELRAGDIVGRVGGDEFLIVQTRRTQPDAAATLANRMVAAFERVFEFDGHLAQLGVSVGIALYPKDGKSPQELIGRADVALYRAKTDGRNCARFFDSDMDAHHRRRKRLAQELRGAVAEGQLEAHYQPQVKIPSGELIGFEALLRWRHPERGLVPPAEFIPLAEETGMIGPVGEWVLRAACHEAAGWERPYMVAVNLSPKQFQQPRLAETVHRILLETGLPAARLELEITESYLFLDFQRALDMLRRLKALGVSIAMDDYGTGYSSLSVLQAFPFDKLKIDRAFIDKLGTGEQAATIVRSVLSLGHSLEIPVLAEGVETARQLEFLTSQKCYGAQGYYFGKPAAARDIRALIANGTVLVPPTDQDHGRQDASPAQRRLGAAS